MATASPSLDIPAPDPESHPQKVNFFEALITSNTQLGPLFHRTSPGSILTLLIYQRGDNRPVGVFEHKNSCDEILICFGSSVGFIRPGQVLMTPREHDVPGIGSGNAEDYFAALYFQRQPLEEDQIEYVGFRCESCGSNLYRTEFRGSDFKAYLNGAGRELIPTTAGTLDAVHYLNANAEVRKCKACGHDNPPFESDGWGWERYMVNADIAARAELSLKNLVN